MSFFRGARSSAWTVLGTLPMLHSSSSSWRRSIEAPSISKRRQHLPASIRLNRQIWTGAHQPLS